MHAQSFSRGLFYAFIAYIAWGSFPVYWHQLHAIPHWEILAHRIVWSAFFLCVLSALAGHAHTLKKVLSQPAVLLRFACSGALLAVNWGTYIYAVNNGHMIESSLGYFICPLVTIVLGLVFFKERLRPSQWMAILLAACGVCIQMVSVGYVPWIALALAGTFACYGAVKKGVSIHAIPGMCLETWAMLPCAAGYLYLLYHTQQAYIPQHASVYEILLLLCSGCVTSMPLIWFSKAATQLPLYMLGFTQFLSPTIQFLLAIAVYKEPFSQSQALCFGFIWAAVAVLVWDGFYSHVHQRRVEATSRG